MTLIPNVNIPNDNIYELEFAPKDFEQGAWLNPDNSAYGRGKRTETSQVETAAMAHRDTNLEYTESIFIVLAKDEPNTYNDAMNSPNAEEWKPSCQAEYDTLMGYHTWELIKSVKKLSQEYDIFDHTCN